MTEKDGVQRVRVGLTGLAIVFLLVLVGTVITRSGHDGPSVSVNGSAEQNGVAEPSDPLSDLGVAPGAASDGNRTAGHNSAH